MLKEILDKLGVEHADDISDEDAKELIDKQIDANNEHIKSLEAEKETLSKSNEELTVSVEGEKTAKEKLDKELSQLKADKDKLAEELSTTRGRLSQVTEMYKEQFTKSPDEQEIDKKQSKVVNDALQFILEAK